MKLTELQELSRWFEGTVTEWCESVPDELGPGYIRSEVVRHMPFRVVVSRDEALLWIHFNQIIDRLVAPENGV